jgi:hypothetical protein
VLHRITKGYSAAEGQLRSRSEVQQVPGKSADRLISDMCGIGNDQDNAAGRCPQCKQWTIHLALMSDGHALGRPFRGGLLQMALDSLIGLRPHLPHPVRLVEGVWEAA